MNGRVTRRDAIAGYRVHLRDAVANGDVTRGELAALCGRELGCWCAPLACHGEVLADAAVSAAGTDEEWAAWKAA